VTDSTARKKVPLPPGYVVPRPQQPPPLRRRDGKTVTGVDVAGPAALVGGSGPVVSAPAPATVSSAVPVVVRTAADEQRAQAAFREAMATLSEDEDKTTAFQVPEELLRRSRTGTPGPAFEDEKSPDSGAVTAPPPADDAVEEVKLGVPGVPKDLDVHSFADDGLEAQVPTPVTSAEEDEHSGEFTRINMAGELEALIPNMERQETTRTVVRKRLEPQPTGTASAVLWAVIGVLSAAGAILATLIAKG
jgi:hypothetical protein